MMKTIAVVGAGISGLSVARMLHPHAHVTVLERADQVGGLVRCDRVAGNLFHRVGGHVFNSRNAAVLDWFWTQFNRDTEFLRANRNAKILLNGHLVGYPIEDHLHQLPAATVAAVLDELLALPSATADNFEAFLKGKFGPTLYQLYFGPYNGKIWNTDLAAVPLDWLEGKLPMPNLRQMLLSNIVRQPEGEMVHATFYYPKRNGSQFIVDRLAEGLRVELNAPVRQLRRVANGWQVNDQVTYDHVIYCGDVRKLATLAPNLATDCQDLLANLQTLPANGTSNLLCETDPTDLSWLYLPDPGLLAHRIIYTGNFSPTNNADPARRTCVVEFSGQHAYDTMAQEVKKLPGNLKPLRHNYEPNSYVIQAADTRQKIDHLKALLAQRNLHLLGRFAEWEYYNMDKAMEAAMRVSADVLAAPA